MLNSIPLEWEDRVQYLGNTLTVSSFDDTDIMSKRGKFIANVNTLMASFGCLSSQVLDVLFHSYCCAFYGSQTWYLGNKMINKLVTAYNKSLCTYGVYPITHIGLLCLD